MSTPFRELQNTSNASASSYETAWSSSFSKRRSSNDIKQNSIEVKDEPISDNEDDMSILENNISMLSVSSPVVRTPPRKAAGGSLEAPLTPGERMLRGVKKEEDRALLRTLYPEMFDDSPQPPEKPKRTIKKEVKIEPISEEENNDKENTPPEKEVRKLRERSRKIQISSSESENDDEEFENYLKSLRDEPVKPARKVPDRKKFVVDDDYISEKSDDSESEEVDSEDEDYRESSPEVEAEAPKTTSKKSKRASDDEEWFLQSLTENFSGPIHEDAKVYVKENSLRQKKRRELLLDRIKDILVRRIFSEIPSERLIVTWNARLRKSAGQCRNFSNGNSTVEMSPVVCTTAQRVRDTLVHEMCHAAVWIVDRLHKEGHGPGWKRWGSRCTAEFRSLPFVERCHSYEIEAKFFYVCENENCGQTIKRQSKSLDTSRKGCGRCSSRFILYRYCRRTNQRVRIEDPKAAKKPAAPAPPHYSSGIRQDDRFEEYAKERYWKYTADGMKHREVMDRLKDEFKKLNQF